MKKLLFLLFIPLSYLSYAGGFIVASYGGPSNTGWECHLANEEYFGSMDFPLEYDGKNIFERCIEDIKKYNEDGFNLEIGWSPSSSQVIFLIII
jgi:hypothetical protein